MQPAIQCKYSCAKCRVHRQIVTMQGRGSEEVITWMDNTCLPALAADHSRRSPGCSSKEFSEVMIPIQNGRNIGEAPIIPTAKLTT